MKTLKKTGLILAVALCLSYSGFSQGKTDLFIQGFIGMSSMTENNMKVGFLSSFGFVIPMNDKIHLSFNFGYWKSEIQEETGGLYSGQLSVNPFLLSVQYFFLSERTVNPFVYLGGGYIFTGFNMEGIITIPEIAISQEVNNVPGFQAGGGLQIKVLEHLAVCAEVAYLYCKAKATTTVQDMNLGRSTEDFSIFLSAFTIQLGLKFYL